MKIIFNNQNLEKAISKIGEFEITNDFAIRVLEDKERISIKMRNIKFENTGRILKLDGIENINQIIFGTETYDNLIYISHETYIHPPSDGEITYAIAEDLNITFKKTGGNLNE